MGNNLRPIGSEKLEGMDKIARIMEIARYKENIPTPINEDKSVEYNKVLADGKNYQIVKEKNGINPNCLIIGTVMRNQRRKLYPDLFEQLFYQSRMQQLSNAGQ